MPSPQVNDRLKEISGQALRTLFATVGQLLLAADRLRAQAAEQLSGSGKATDAAPSQQDPPAQQATAQAQPAKPTQAARAKPTQAARAKPTQAARATARAKRAQAGPAKPAKDAGAARWRSLDKTGNVRVLDGDEEGLFPTSAPAGTADPAPSFQEPPASAAPAAPAAPAVPEPSVPEPSVPEPSVPEPSVPEPSVPEPSVPEPVTPAPAKPVPAPAEYTPTEPVPVVPAAPADPAVPAAPAEPALPAPTAAEALPSAPAEPAAPAETALPPAPAESDQPAAPGEVLPLPHYGQLSVASLRARLRVLDATQVHVLLDYEKAHEGRPAVITMFERRLAKLSEGS